MSTSVKPNVQPDDFYVGLGYITAKFQVGLDAIHSAIQRGELPAFRVGPKLIRVRKVDADAWAKPIKPTDAHTLHAADGPSATAEEA